MWASTATEFSVSTSGLAAPKTCGLLAFKPKDITRPAYDASRCAAMEARDVPHPDAIYGFASETATFDTATPTKTALPFSTEAAVAFPGGHLQFDKRYLEASARDDFDARQALSNDMLDNLARAIADGLGRIDGNLATRAALVSYVRQYDAPLAGRLAENTTTTADAARLKLISQLADAERKWVHAQDARVVNQVLDGAQMPSGLSYLASVLRNDSITCGLRFSASSPASRMISPAGPSAIANSMLSARSRPMQMSASKRSNAMCS